MNPLEEAESITSPAFLPTHGVDPNFPEDGLGLKSRVYFVLVIFDVLGGGLVCKKINFPLIVMSQIFVIFFLILNFGLNFLLFLGRILFGLFFHIFLLN